MSFNVFDSFVWGNFNTDLGMIDKCLSGFPCVKTNNFEHF